MNLTKPEIEFPEGSPPADLVIQDITIGDGAEATTGHQETHSHDRVRTDRVDKSGKITLRHGGRLYSIGIGRTHARTRVIVLVHDLDIRIIDAATGELLRELVLDPSQRYQGTGRPPGPTS